jgi:asparagine synthase (glutamine-hydrolysing)
LNARSFTRRLRRFLAVAHQPQFRRYSRWLGYFTEEAKADLYTPEWRATLPGERPEAWIARLFEEAPSLDPVEAAMAADIQSYLPFDLLVKVDITSMANGLEARSPFLDHELMELAARLPVGWKLRGAVSKYLLKRACADLLPRENAHRAKMGFGIPVGEWLRGPLRELLEETLLSRRALGRGYFNPNAVRRLALEHVERRADHSFQLWNLLMVELWHQEVVERQRVCA